MNTTPNNGMIALILLAAGESRRLGSPKQLIVWEGKTLLRRAVETAVASVCSPIVVVLGAKAARMHEELHGLPVWTVTNESWQDGIGTSIRTGIETVKNIAEVQGAILMQCDQPHITSALIDALVTEHRTGSPLVVASEYGDTLGSPALFDRTLFAELSLLNAESGARKLIAAHADQTGRVPFPAGVLDIDTPADVIALTSRSAAIAA